MYKNEIIEKKDRKKLYADAETSQTQNTSPIPFLHGFQLNKTVGERVSSLEKSDLVADAYSLAVHWSSAADIQSCIFVDCCK